MKNTGQFILIFSSLLIAGHSAFSSSTPEICDASREKPCLVEDTSKRKPISSLRDTGMISGAHPGNITGIKRLHASASSEPSEQGWQRVADYIHARSGYQPGQVLVLDLRQESHGYLNGKAITLCDKHNWLNVGKTTDEAIKSERAWLQDLSEKEHIDNIITANQFQQNDFANGKSITVKSLTSEKDLIKRWQFSYLRLAVSDHRAPLDAVVDQFVSRIDALPDDVWLHIHCRGGKGRTTSFLAMYDMLKNADKVSFDEIIQRQASIPPYYDLSCVNRGDPNLMPWYQQRLQFLREFYHYAQSRLSGQPIAWSEWKMTQA